MPSQYATFSSASQSQALEGLLPQTSLCIEQAWQEEGTLWIAAHADQPEVLCPRCYWASHQIHSRYHRVFEDLPCCGQPLKWCVLVRRFRCLNPTCPQRIFCEPLTEVARSARRSQRVVTLLTHVGLTAGGQAGARLSRQCGLGCSASTMLRFLRRAPLSGREDPRHVGVDDFAWKKGRRYGTLLVDLQAHCVLEVLADRSTATFARWLEAHPSVELVSRDRGQEYAKAIQQVAPQVTQVVDRFHLVRNLAQVLQEGLQSLAAPIAQVPCPAPTSAQTPRRSPYLRTDRQKHQQESRQRRWERYELIHELAKQGLSRACIAERANCSFSTVTRMLAQEHFPERQPTLARPGQLGPYESYLLKRIHEGETNAMALLREINALGYPGKWQMVNRFVASFRSSSSVPVPKGQGLTPREASWLIIRPTEKLETSQRLSLQLLCDCDPQVRRWIDLCQTFLSMLRQHDPTQLDAWWQAVEMSDLPKLQNFAAQLSFERQAVEAALRLPQSNGQLEGQVARLKLLKRSMYGRANLDLLRQRLLYRDALLPCGSSP